MDYDGEQTQAQKSGSEPVRKKRANIAYSIVTYEADVTTAFQMDVESFLMKYEEKKSLKFNTFAAIWREMGFSFVFGGDEHYFILKRFLQNAFFTLKKFIVYPRNIYIQVGALYLLYSLYFKQPIEQWIKIRLTMAELEKFQELCTQLRKRKEFQALYVYAKLIQSDAFIYTALKLPLGPEEQYLKGRPHDFDDTFTSKASESSINKIHQVLNENNFLTNFKELNEKYTKALQKYSKKEPGLASFESTIMAEINTTVKKIQQNIVGGLAEAEEEDDDEVMEIFKKRKILKEKAMRNFTSSRRIQRKFDSDPSTS